MKWEYCVVNSGHNVDELNRLGAYGWEAVAIHPDGWLLMKRPKSN